MKEKRSALAQLIKLAKADHRLEQMEFNLILKIGNILGLSEKEVKELFEENVEFHPPGSEFARIEQFHRLLLVANVDLKMESEELIHLKNFGIKLGLRPEAIERVLIEMTDHPNGMIPAPVMLKIFQTYHN